MYFMKIYLLDAESDLLHKRTVGERTVHSPDSESRLMNGAEFRTENQGPKRRVGRIDGVGDAGRRMKTQCSVASCAMEPLVHIYYEYLLSYPVSVTRSKVHEDSHKE